METYCKYKHLLRRSTKVRSRRRYLLECALLRIFVWSPSDQFRPVPEAIICVMVKSNLDDQLRRDGHPLATAVCAPAAWAARRFAGKAWRFAQGVKAVR